MQSPRSACVLDPTKVLKRRFPMRPVQDALEAAIGGLKARLRDSLYRASDLIHQLIGKLPTRNGDLGFRGRSTCLN